MIVSKIEFDSRLVNEGDVYVAIPGVNVDGHDFITQAIQNGAKCIISEKTSEQKIEGIVYGGTSRKVRNYLQISNKLFVSHTSKNENRIGYFKSGEIKPFH